MHVRNPSHVNTKYIYAGSAYDVETTRKKSVKVSQLSSAFCFYRTAIGVSVCVWRSRLLEMNRSVCVWLRSLPDNNWKDLVWYGSRSHWCTNSMLDSHNSSTHSSSSTNRRTHTCSHRRCDKNRRNPRAFGQLVRVHVCFSCCSSHLLRTMNMCVRVMVGTL